MALRARDVGLPLMNLVKTKGIPILQQLYLEEKLLRTSSDNWCIINDGTDQPAIVMGVSGKSAELVEEEPVLLDHIPVIRRFTGGGTVIVDDGTIFVTLICNKGAIPGLQPYPRPIMSWTGQLYGEVLHEYGDFQLRENDYAFGSRKFGGNAQSITKNRWIHHTSFLWDYDVKNMGYLKHPMKAPSYRSYSRTDKRVDASRRHGSLYYLDHLHAPQPVASAQSTVCASIPSNVIFSLAILVMCPRSVLRALFSLVRLVELLLVDGKWQTISHQPLI